MNAMNEMPAPLVFTDSAAAKVHEVPVIGEPVHARVLAHRRHDNAVGERGRADLQRLEEVRHRCRIEPVTGFENLRM